MRKKLLLLLAALCVAIIPGRETSALSTSPTNCEKEASVSRWKPLINAFGMPTHPVNGYVEMGKAGLRIVMLPLGAEAGRHIRPENSESEKSAKDLELSKSMVSNPLAMLPLGRESGRHIRTENVQDVDSEAAKQQSANPVAELNGYLGNSYAMLPVVAETGRDIRNEDTRAIEGTVAANEPKARA